MTKCSKFLASAVMGVSMCTAAWAQQSPTDPNAGPGSPSAPGASATPAAGDAMGAPDMAQSHDMMKGGNEADMKIGENLDKIATMPDKAGDALFVLDNAKGNMFEVEFAKLAESKSDNDKIKDLAKMIEKDHTEANDKLKPIAQKMGLDLPTSLPSEKQKMLKVFSALSPADFNTCYLLDNKAVHAKDITSFADHEKAVKDPELKAYISEVLPKLKEHGMHVSQLAADMGYPMMGGMGHGKMDHDMGGMDKGGEKGMNKAGDGANADPTAPANNQNPSNR